MTDLAIWGQSREGKTLSYSWIKMLFILDFQILDFLEIFR